MSFIFGGDTGLTYEQMKKKRDLANALVARRSQAPQTFGEGLSAIGEALLYRSLDKKSSEAEKAGKEKANSAFNAILGGQAMGGPQAPPRAPTAAPTGGSGGMSSYRDAIASIESAGSGDYAAVGPTNKRLGRALGRYQIMEANIGPWSREALGREVTADEFLQNPQIQDAIFDHRFGSYVEKFGPEGAAQAWFAGPGGVGKMGRKDVLGTSVADYTSKFSNALGGSQNGQNAQNVQMAQSGPGVEQIMAAMSNPYMSQEQKSALGMMLQQRIQSNDPMRQMQLEKGQLELDRMRNPQPEPGYTMRRGADLGMTGENAERMFNVGPNGKVTAIGGGGVTVNTGNQGQEIGTIPQGYTAVKDPTNPSGYRLEAIPGGPEDTSQKDALREQAQVDQANLLSEDISRAISIVTENPATSTGFLGSMLKNVGGTQAANLAALSDTIGANISFEALNAMRAQSPTGGALGNVTERELQLLKATQGSIEQSQTSDQLLENLRRLERQFDEVVNGPSNGQTPTQAPEMTFEQFSADPSAQAAARQYGVTLEEMWAIKQGVGR